MIALGQKIVLASIVIVCLWMCVGIFIYRSSLQFTGDNNDINNKLINPKSPELELEYCKTKSQKLTPGFWQRINLHKKRIPESIKELLPMITVESSTVVVQGTNVHYMYAKPKESIKDIPILLLHGQSYTSETWNELGTISILAALGYYPIAVDLPGFGRTSSKSDLNKSYFIDDLIAALNIKKPVLVSPSMSGSFSLKYLIEHSENLGGYIPVSPVQTSILSDAMCKDHEDDSSETSLNEDCQKIMHYLKSDGPKLNCIKVPSLIVWGERDKGENSAKLCLLPNSQGAEIPEGKHATYLTNPDLWHKLLYNFLSILDETQACR